jgi:hypothetical protein
MMKLNGRIAAITVLLFLTACKSKHQADSGSEVPVAHDNSSGEQPKEGANQTKQYTVQVTPDTAVLGKSREALVKITGATAVALQDPDGKDNGLEVVIHLQLTNKTHIGVGSPISVGYPDSRLQLDNGNNITCNTGTDFLRAEPEATSKEESWTYEVPAGVKPKALNLFMDGTRVTVEMSLK